MEKFTVKFFGAKKERGEQITQVKTEVEAQDRSQVEEALRKKGYKVINSLKIR